MKEKCDFDARETTRGKIHLVKGATLIREQPGHAHYHYEQKPWKKDLDFVLQTTSKRFEAFQLAVNGRGSRLAGFW